MTQDTLKTFGKLERALWNGDESALTLFSQLPNDAIPPNLERALGSAILTVKKVVYQYINDNNLIEPKNRAAEKPKSKRFQRIEFE